MRLRRVSELREIIVDSRVPRCLIINGARVSHVHCASVDCYDALGR